MSTLYVGQATREKLHSATEYRARMIGFVKRTGYLHRSVLVLLGEIGLAVASYALAVFILAEGGGAAWAIAVLRATLGILVLFRLAALASVRLYRRSLRYASLLDLISIAKTVSCSSILLWGFVWGEFGGR